MLALAAMFAARNHCSAQHVPGGQPGTQAPSTPQDTFAKYQGLLVERISWPNVPADADQQRLQQLSSQKEGAPLDRDLIRESIHQLYGTGLFSEIRVEVERTTDDKVALTIVTAP